jgi:hypothetical protein
MPADYPMSSDTELFILRAEARSLLAHLGLRCVWTLPRPPGVRSHSSRISRGLAMHILLTVKGAVRYNCIRPGIGCLKDYSTFPESRDSSHPEVQTPLVNIKISGRYW